MPIRLIRITGTCAIDAEAEMVEPWKVQLCEAIIRWVWLLHQL